MMIPSPELESIGLVALAALLAGLIGVEREVSAKPAGFRTHMLTGGAAALLVILGHTLIESYGSDTESHPYLRTDPTRIMEAIIVGISFIGAGTVLKVPSEDTVRYLTTAASILLSSGIGIAVALKQFYLASAVVLTVLSINVIAGKLVKMVERNTGTGEKGETGGGGT